VSRVIPEPIVLPLIGRSDSYTVNPSKIIALGLNYRDHIAESLSVKVNGLTTAEPAEPVLFPKLPSALIGPGESILLPAIVDTYGFDDPRTDHEAELAVIIGSVCRNVPVSEAMDQVFGYTCMNDVSQRNIQNGDRSGWFRGKSFDTFAPIGPAVLPASGCPDVQNLDIACRLNGKTVQSSNTRNMIFTVAVMISFISRNFTLYPNDIILTGTPSGVGPLKPGDTVEVEISEIGVLRNPVAAGS
jgi:2-keto-4-pentenoate hydratase/2-oxohepta-3-ene-1,7-dioic acid hydratase in catechol pathway